MAWYYFLLRNHAEFSVSSKKGKITTSSANKFLILRVGGCIQSARHFCDIVVGAKRTFRQERQNCRMSVVFLNVNRLNGREGWSVNMQYHRSCMYLKRPRKDDNRQAVVYRPPQRPINQSNVGCEINPTVDRREIGRVSTIYLRNVVHLTLSYQRSIRQQSSSSVQLLWRHVHANSDSVDTNDLYICRYSAGPHMG